MKVCPKNVNASQIYNTNIVSFLSSFVLCGKLSDLSVVGPKPNYTTFYSFATKLRIRLIHDLLNGPHYYTWK